MLGVKESISVRNQKFVPIRLGRIEFFSMTTISGERPVSMSASQYAQVLFDVLRNTEWESEIGIIDMPAGVHDELIELITRFGSDILGSIVVLQPAHIQSAKRMLELHRSEGIPVLGVISNMAYFVCPLHDEPKIFRIFGDTNLEELCKEYGVEPLGEIPLSIEIRENIEKGNPILPEEFIKPIDIAAEKVINAKPIGESLVERIKERLKGVARDALIRLIFAAVEIANTEVPIKAIQNEVGFPGGRIIELDITDETLRNVKLRCLFKVENGVLKMVKPSEKVRVDDEIRVWDKALIWSLTGIRKDTNMPFTLWDAWLTGKLQFYSNSGTGTQRALMFMRNVLERVKQTPSFAKLASICEGLA